MADTIVLNWKTEDEGKDPVPITITLNFVDNDNVIVTGYDAKGSSYTGTLNIKLERVTSPKEVKNIVQEVKGIIEASTNVDTLLAAFGNDHCQCCSAGKCRTCPCPGTDD